MSLPSSSLLHGRTIDVATGSDPRPRSRGARVPRVRMHLRLRLVLLDAFTLTVAWVAMAIASSSGAESAVSITAVVAAVVGGLVIIAMLGLYRSKVSSVRARELSRLMWLGLSVPLAPAAVIGAGRPDHPVGGAGCRRRVVVPAARGHAQWVRCVAARPAVEGRVLPQRGDRRHQLRGARALSPLRRSPGVGLPHRGIHRSAAADPTTGRCAVSRWRRPHRRPPPGPRRGWSGGGRGGARRSRSTTSASRRSSKVASMSTSPAVCGASATVESSRCRSDTNHSSTSSRRRWPAISWRSSARWTWSYRRCCSFWRCRCCSSAPSSSRCTTAVRSSSASSGSDATADRSLSTSCVR